MERNKTVEKLEGFIKKLFEYLHRFLSKFNYARISIATLIFLFFFAGIHRRRPVGESINCFIVAAPGNEIFD
jgi:hypothetical protein